MNDRPLERGHFGCPECGDHRFKAVRNVVEYNDEEITAAWENEAETDFPDWTVEDTGETHYGYHENGDLEGLKTCVECDHEYEDPIFYHDLSPLERVARASELPLVEIEAFQEHIHALSKSARVVIRVVAHATVIHAQPGTMRRRLHGERHHRVDLCCLCGEVMSLAYERCRAVFVDNERFYSKREALLDERGLPVMLRASYCRFCVREVGL